MKTKIGSYLTKKNQFKNGKEIQVVIFPWYGTVNEASKKAKTWMFQRNLNNTQIKGVKVKRDLWAIIKVSLNGKIKREWPLTYALWPCPCFQMWFWWSFFGNTELIGWSHRLWTRPIVLFNLLTGLDLDRVLYWEN